MVNYELEKNLQAIAGGGKLDDVVFGLIKWAEAEGELERLIITACNDKSGNHKLKAIKQKLNIEISNLWVHGWVKQCHDNSPTAELDWTKYFDINTQPRRIADQATWDKILFPSLMQARDELTQGRAKVTIDVRGRMPLTAAVAIRRVGF